MLLPDAGRSAGLIAVSGGAASRTLNTAWEAVAVSEAGDHAGMPFEYRPARAADLFAAALDQQPLPPTVHVLYFESGTEDLNDDSRPRIKDVLATIVDRRWPQVSVVGHSDRAGDREANLALSLDRAEAVAELLVRSGIDPEVIEVSSHGEANPLVPTPDGVSEPRNRRVEVIVR